MAKSPRVKWVPDIFDVVEGFVTREMHPDFKRVSDAEMQLLGVSTVRKRGWIPKRGCWLPGQVQSREFERGKLIRIGIRLPGIGNVIEVSRWRRPEERKESQP